MWPKYCYRSRQVSHTNSRTTKEQKNTVSFPGKYIPIYRLYPQCVIAHSIVVMIRRHFVGWTRAVYIGHSQFLLSHPQTVQPYIIHSLNNDCAFSRNVCILCRSPFTAADVVDDATPSDQYMAGALNVRSHKRWCFTCIHIQTWRSCENGSAMCDIMCTRLVLRQRRRVRRCASGDHPGNHPACALFYSNTMASDLRHTHTHNEHCGSTT